GRRRRYLPERGQHHPADRRCPARAKRRMATAAPLHADRGNGRTYTAADRRRSGETSTHGGLSDGHLKLHPDLHHLDGRDPGLARIGLTIDLIPGRAQTGNAIPVHVTFPREKLFDRELVSLADRIERDPAAADGLDNRRLTSDGPPPVRRCRFG